MNSEEKQIYWKKLEELEEKVHAGYDKTVITLSGGALGLSLTFIKNITVEKALERYLAHYAVSFWGFSLSSLLLAYFCGILAYKRAKKMLLKNKLNEKNPGEIYAHLTNIFSALGGIAFILGVIYIVRFINKNI